MREKICPDALIGCHRPASFAAGFTAFLMDGLLMRINTVKGFLLGLAVAAPFMLSAAAPAGAVVYCKYIGYPKGCVAKPGVVLVPRPAPAVRAATPGVGAPGVNTPVNRGGPVNRVGRR